MTPYSKDGLYVKIIAVVLSAMALCALAIYNGYPFTFNNDTAMYIDAANMGLVRFDRPILYGLFVMFISLQKSLWLVIIVQALIVTLTVYYYFRYFSPGKVFVPWFVGYIAFVALFMGASFNVSWLMPDVFTSVSILCIGLLLLAQGIRRRDRIVISLLAILSIAMHNSHFYTCLGLTILLFAGFLTKPVRRIYKTAGITRMRFIVVIALIVTSNLFLSSIHYHYGGFFKSSRGGPVFLMGSLVDMGVVDTYLAENCGKKKYLICQYKDSLPSNFLWDQNSPVYLTGGWVENEPEYTAIIKDIFTTPRYLKMVAFNSVILTFEQFFHFNTGEAPVPSKEVKDNMAIYYPLQYGKFSSSRQYRGALNFDGINFTQTLIASCCFLIYLLVLLFGKMTIKYRLLMVFIILSLLVNAWVCGTFSGVFPRYQSRLLWLLPLPLFLYLMERFKIVELSNHTE